MPPKKEYEKATLYAPKGSATWLIIWGNLNPKTNKIERVRKTFDLNRIADLKERKVKAYGIVSVLNEALQNGWNVFTDPARTASAKKLTTTLQAFQQAYHVKTIGNSTDSIKSYKSIAGIFTDWLKASHLDAKPVGTFTAATFQKYISERHAAGKSARNINAHINLVRAVFEKMHKPMGIITENPLRGFDMLQETDSDLYEIITDQELQDIGNYLKKKDPGFYLFTQFIYWASIRPAHLAGLKVSQLDFKNDQIQIIGTNTKSKRNSTKEMLPELRRILVAAGVQKMDLNSYLFGTNFKPAAKPVASLSTRATEAWMQYVKEDLGINKLMYALKHTFATKYINENEDPDPIWLQRQMEHSSITETQAYIHKRKTKKVSGKAKFGKY